MKTFLTCFFLFLIAFVKISEARNLYTIAVVPQFPPTYLQENWGKILQAMEEETGLKFELIIYKSIPEFEKGF